MRAESMGLKDRELEEIINVLSSFHNVELGIIYGSRAKGNYKPFSDIDLTLCGKNLNNNDILRIAGRLEDSDLPYLFDVSDYSQLMNQDLIDHIDRRGITIYRK